MSFRLEDEEKIVRFYFPGKFFVSTAKAGNVIGNEPAVRENRQYIYNQFGVVGDEVVHMNPNHLSHVEMVDESYAGEWVDGDALVTTVPDLPLEVSAGDCFPIAMSGRGAVLALVHGGRKSVEEGVIRNALISMDFKLSWSLRPESVQVAIGPGLKKCCYAFEVQQNLIGKQPEWHKYISENHLDLERWIIEELKELGIKEKNITSSSFCTYCSKDNEGNPLFFSHKRVRDKEEDGTQNREKEQRFLAIAVG